MIRPIFLNVLLLTSVFCFSQNKIADSLHRALKEARNDTTRINQLLHLADLYKKANPDSNLFYIEKALILTKNRQNDRLSGNFQYLEAQCYKRLVNWCFQHGKTDEAIQYLGQAITIYERLSKSEIPVYPEKVKSEMGDSYYGLGRIYGENGQVEKAIEYYFKALVIKEEINDKISMAKCYNNIGTIYFYQGNYDAAIGNYHKSLKIREEISDKMGISNSYINLGLVYNDQGKFDKAIENYLNALKIKEELNDYEGMSNCYNNIGNIHADQKNYNLAVDYYNKSLIIREKQHDKKGMSACYINIGLVYAEQDFIDKAKEYYLKAIEIFKELNDKGGMADCYNNLGIVFKKQNNYKRAVEYYLKSLEIRKQTGDVNGIAIVHSNLASLYLNMASSVRNDQSLEKNNHLNKALVYGLKAMSIAAKTGTYPLKNTIAHDLMEIYKALGNNTKALEFAEIYIRGRDSLLLEEKTRALAEMEARYQTEKKQQEIEKQQILLDKQKLEIMQTTTEKSRQRVMLFAFAAAFFLTFILAIVIYRSSRLKTKANRLLMKLNAEIFQQKEEILSQSEEIEIQNKKITNSIQYASLIQLAVLPDPEIVGTFFSSYFLIYKPCEIVSGDFYFIKKVENRVYLAVADCTGHGVPGAFMSILGATLINEIIHRKSITEASQALDQLRILIKESLQQKGNRNEQTDSIDIAFCMINLETLVMNFSGANIPLWLFNSNRKDSEDILHIFEADFQPAGIYVKEKPFTEHIIQLRKNDTFYIFTDGYKSQFGGEKGRRYKDKQLKELLIDIQSLPMPEQKEIIETRFTDWKGNYEQIDDVLVLGVKV